MFVTETAADGLLARKLLDLLRKTSQFCGVTQKRKKKHPEKNRKKQNLST